jgi:hypothetical protein
MPEVLITENIIGEEMDKLRERFDSVFEPNLWKEPTIIPKTNDETINP